MYYIFKECKIKMPPVLENSLKISKDVLHAYVCAYIKGQIHL